MSYVFQLCLKFEIILRSFSTDSSFILISQQESGKWPDEHICEVWYIKCIRASVQREKSFFLMIRKLITMSEEWNSLGKNCFLINRKTNNYVGGIEN